MKTDAVKIFSLLGKKHDDIHVFALVWKVSQAVSLKVYIIKETSLSDSGDVVVWRVAASRFGNTVIGSVV